MTFEQAYAISHYLLKNADVKNTQTLDFSEYFSASVRTAKRTASHTLGCLLCAL